MSYFNPTLLTNEGLDILGLSGNDLHMESYLPNNKIRREERARSLLLEKNASYLRSIDEPLLEDLSESDIERRLSTIRPPVLFDIFLSFSSVDWTIVLALYDRLTRRYGKKVYVDRFVDPNLNPAMVSRATGIVLRRRLAQSKSLFCATSQATTRSAWVPWELGYEDGYTGKVAIVPIISGVQFSGREYFEIYPEVKEQPVGLQVCERGFPPVSWDVWVAQPRRL
jgi:hypothetical protein